MYNLNRYSFTGYIGNAKSVESENPFTSVSVAVDESYTNPTNQEKVERVKWVEVQLKGTEQLPYLTKGRHVLVEGRPVADAYLDGEGKATAKLIVKSAAVTYLDKKPELQEA
ncbi:single-stranded DNA-binding protein [Spirosoma pollinicola]|uniref:Single-stranded DNA-binding protein n=1 Tax=Spirosoma pollinicola TaxID=2057025 RepID=A0A2K8Z9E7_9BACT|nr:single-stranded DNA-binding protein [Spirosoma pollinicola]AUD06474.1 hypothetical protein CWM47_34305 [Spirosoma pollinicola]